MGRVEVVVEVEVEVKVKVVVKVGGVVVVEVVVEVEVGVGVEVGVEVNHRQVVAFQTSLADKKTNSLGRETANRYRLWCRFKSCQPACA